MKMEKAIAMMKKHGENYRIVKKESNFLGKKRVETWHCVTSTTILLRFSSVPNLGKPGHRLMFSVMVGQVSLASPV